MIQNEVLEFLKANPVQYAATVGLDGAPKVRPFQFIMEDGGRLWFCTNSQKRVFQELKANPRLELCVSSPSYAWIRVSGRVEFSKDMEIKGKVIEANSLVKSIYKTADNPIFEIFALAEAKAVISDFSGNPPKSFSLLNALT
jgi:uncharacterized pyridoxamine 5'-phosphate oxidase family protein